MSRSFSINLYLRPFRLLFMEKLICLYLFSLISVCTYSDFFLVCKLYKSSLQIMHVISDHLRFMDSADIGGSVVTFIWHTAACSTLIISCIFNISHSLTCPKTWRKCPKRLKILKNDHFIISLSTPLC